MGNWDDRLLYWINEWPQAWNPFLKFFSVALSQTWVKYGFGLMLVAMLFRNVKTRKAVLIALISIGIANTLTNVAKEGFPMNRPFQDHGYVKVEDGVNLSPMGDRVRLRVGHSDGKGTASAHSANMAALAFAMCYFLGWWGVPWIGVALLTGISRVYTGAHYPSQVLLGWMCGIFAALVVIKTWEAFVLRKRGVQSEGDEATEHA